MKWSVLLEKLSTMRAMKIRLGNTHAHKQYTGNDASHTLAPGRRIQ